MGGQAPAGGDAILQMQGGVRDWVQRIAGRSKRGLRSASPAVLLSLLCASAFCPLLMVTGVAGAGVSVLAAVGGGFLTQVISDALDGLRQRCQGSTPSRDDLEKGIAHEIERVLAAGDEQADALRSEIAAVLKEIDAGGTALRAAMEQGNERVRSDVLAAIGVLGSDFGELGFLLKDVAHAAAEIQKSLDVQGANIRAIIEQNTRQSTDIRLVREDLAVIAGRGRSGGQADARRGAWSARWAGGCPYRGLLPFGEADAEVFYGRERLSAELAVKLAAQVALGDLIVVTGASGAGKSSLLRAGLLPILARGQQVQGSDRWPRIVMTPTKDPLTELAARLAAITGGDTVEIRDGLIEHPDQAHLAVWSAALAVADRHDGVQPAPSDNTARLVLIVDQFEQVFTLVQGPGGEASRQAFITALASAATKPVGPGQEPPALVVIAVRGDFWDRCAAYPDLVAGLQDGQFVVGPMSDSELRVAITGPAAAAGLRIEPALTEAILGDLRVAGRDGGAGVLPLLSQAMVLTWEVREGNRLTSHGYGQTGGVSRAVQTGADKAYDALPAIQQALAREILRSMTVASRDGRLARRPVTRADLYSEFSGVDHEQVNAVLEAFAAGRLMILNDDTAQIAHDVLLHAWPRLRAWLEEDQASWILYGQLADASAAWKDNNSDPAFVYRGAQLATVQKAAATWAENPARSPGLTRTQRDFLEASKRAAARSARQRRILATSLVLLLIAASTLAVLAGWSASNANQQRNNAESAELAAQSEQLGSTDPATAALLAAAAWRIAHTEQARESMLEVLAQPERAVLPDPVIEVDTVAFSPDGQVLAAGSNMGPVQLWDVSTGRPIGTITAQEPVQDPSVMAFSPDGKILATGSPDGSARLWDVASQRPIGRPMISPDMPVDGIAFLPGGKILVTGNAEGTVQLWDVATQRPLGRPMLVGGGLDGLAVSPNGKILATADCSNDLAQLWDVATQSPMGSAIGPGRSSANSGCRGEAVAFSPQGNLLATLDYQGRVQFWNAGTHQQIGQPVTIAGTGNVPDLITGLDFSPNGKILATSEDDGMARLWDVASGLPLGAPITAGDYINALAFSPDGHLLATADSGNTNTVRLWNPYIYRPLGAPIVTSRETASAATAVTSIAFSKNGKFLATADADGAARLWNAATEQPIGPTVGATVVGYLAQNAALSLMAGVAISPNGKLLATSNHDGDVRLWSTATLQPIGKTMQASNEANDVAFSPDGTMLLTGDGNGTAQLWSVATHRPIGTFAGPPGGIPDAAVSAFFSPDGHIVVTFSDDTAQLWNVSTRQPIGQAITVGSTIADVAFNPAGTVLATADQGGTVKLWSVATQSQIGISIAASAPSSGVGSTSPSVKAVTFSPDGTLLATTGSDGTARLWDVATQRQIGPSMTPPKGIGPGASVRPVAFSPDGDTLAIGNYQVAGQWDVAFPADLNSAVCSIAGPSLTPQVWDTYIQSLPYQKTCP